MKFRRPRTPFSKRTCRRAAGAGRVGTRKRVEGVSHRLGLAFVVAGLKLRRSE